jgi:hypothetical protein
VKSIGNVAILGGLLAAAVHFVRYGRKHVDEHAESTRHDAGGAV